MFLRKEKLLGDQSSLFQHVSRILPIRKRKLCKKSSVKGDEESALETGKYAV